MTWSPIPTAIPLYRPMASKKMPHPGVRFGTLQPNFIKQLNTPLDQAVFTVLDCETTGLNPTLDDFTEITAIKFQNGKEIARFSTFVKPNKPIPSNVEQITGITNAMVQGAPEASVVLPKLLAFIDNAPLLVGDFIGFDIAFFQNKLDHHGLSAYKDRFVLEQSFCTRKLASRYFPQEREVRAKAIGQLMGLPMLPDHRAENDVLNTASVFFELLKRLKTDGVEMDPVGHLHTYQGTAFQYRGY